MVGGRVTTNFGGVDVVPFAEWTLQGAIAVVPLLGAIAGCHCSVLWLGGRVTTNFGGVDVVPLITQKWVFAIWGLCWYNFKRSLECFEVSLFRSQPGICGGLGSKTS